VFELGLLQRLGIGPSVDGCVGCGRRGADLDAEVVRWLPDRGGVVCARCARGGAVISTATRRALASLQGLSVAEADEAPLHADAGPGCRQALGDLIAHHVPGTLKSLTFIEKMSRAPRG
jgi:recombinational DNA repair protein (RecF pathway)